MNHARSTGQFLCHCWQSCIWDFDYCIGNKYMALKMKTAWNNVSSMCCHMWLFNFSKTMPFRHVSFIYLNCSAAPGVSTVLGLAVYLLRTHYVWVNYD